MIGLLITGLALVMIVEEVLGGWALLKEWRQQEWAGEGGGALADLRTLLLKRPATET